MKADHPFLSDRVINASITFHHTWSSTKVKETLVHVFRLASLGGLDHQAGLASPENVARLFDDLNDLLAELHQYHALNTTHTTRLQEGAQHV